MDYHFPLQLFPSFYNCGPPDSVLKNGTGSWGSYDGVLPQALVRSPVGHLLPDIRLEGRLGVTLSPSWSPSCFPKTMQNFFMDHCQDAFGCMSDILGENFNFRSRGTEKHRHVSVWRVKRFLKLLNYKICFRTHKSSAMSSYCRMLSNVVPDIPPPLLGSLLYEELAEQRDHMLFCEGDTGGALAFVPFAERGKNVHQRGCLLYPGGQGLDRLKFRKVDLQHCNGSVSCVDASNSSPVSFQLKAPIRQISCTSLFNDCCVAVRSDHFCGVWRFSETDEPRLLQVVNTNKPATCVSVSPHVLGEILVASESGAANLWTVGKGMQKVRMEDSNLYFNAKSSWRWCEFSAHPRVMLYADRTGVELTDIRVSLCSGHTLFRISNTSECRSGERLILSRYLGDVHPFHHLITTQYSAYIMDERFPCVPMLKYDHMMQSPPIFCHVIPGSATSASTSSTNKVLLGSHSSQEVTLLQYSGGKVGACSSRGPPQALLRPRESLKHLSVQIPHRRDAAANRLSAPVAGLTCIPKKAGSIPGRRECMCVLQLTEAGDIFYQVLEHNPTGLVTSGAPSADSKPRQAATELPGSTRLTAEPPADSQVVVSETSSDEDVIGLTQGVSARMVVAETPERDQRQPSRPSVSSSEESERFRDCRSGLQPRESQSDEDVNNEKVVDDEGAGSSRSLLQTSGKLSSSVSVKWKHWLQILVERNGKKKPRPRRLQHFQIFSKGLLRLPDSEARGAPEKEIMEKLREELKSCMSGRSLLVQRSVSLTAPDPVPLHQVSTSWTDTLSHRLTVAWQGEKAWQAWWEDQLGMNEKTKMAALRRKRRREKEAKRAAGHRLELSGSFTSASDQSELDIFSSSTGWTTASSQGLWSNTEDGEALSQSAEVLEHENQRAPTASTIQTDIPVPTPTAQSVQSNKNDQQSPSRLSTFSLTQTQTPDRTPARQRRSKRTVEDYLSTLTSTQDYPSQADSYFLENDSFTDTPPPPALLHSSQPLRVSMSRVAGPSSGLSQSLTSSQCSQGWRGPSQSSQPKKKSRMGF
ncbi:TATA box-binding protein-associated factor RNA polymerase I subunit C isoform X2 [Melanotaenia boesemani]|uniref:TATA box-binding protein-associated factor RNA polymerase I subunit C isoform X2 n=1 Tax=Melanotaenia boesemani TaxID=1250792 RepID=UPI001C05D9D9|nr:TATA box-binding protein-associated factor RNA polymerase I subunit C isoform X2 [Melanotaenia boesemani]